MRYGKTFPALGIVSGIKPRAGKSLDRIIDHPRIKKQFVKGQILSQSVTRNRNIFTGEPMIDLRVTISVGHSRIILMSEG
ncbi:MAG: hypothetical protein M3O71_32380 [Bacteroidota bacterium]|nr:hypothetical protein [Bacteroidota bacterium]